MSNAPVYEIDPTAFWNDPYPDLKAMRATMPVAYVPQLGATLITRRDDIFVNEKIIDVFSSDQPEGLMTQLLGQNLMRKDGQDHMAERKAIFPTVSPKTAKNVWKQAFEAMTARVLDEIAPQGRADLVRDIARRISGEAIKIITGLTNMSWQDMDRVSQGMIDGIANYQGDPAVKANCDDCTAAIEAHIDEMVPVLRQTPDMSLLSVHLQAGLSRDQYYANVKLAISGGQNEVRDVIAGLIWAMLTHPEQMQMVQDKRFSWLDAFEEYSRWISPVGMSPRRVARRYDLHGVTLEPDDRVFFMFGSGNRDEAVFDRPEQFDLTQNAAASAAFGAGPHFCAGAWAARCLIADVAVPMIFERLRGLRLQDEARFGGWAFRGPLAMPVSWDVG
ncbi:cytochrome P450 [Ruegeria sp.]|uniref:cytochrome P450 n=1 Tax=Ruegeria sp. TaxID=1879320 RepID=UPI002324EA68|nr:cytochrome P450 [Ruegeria sp.]MDA7965920.1 cytochrome P450 [Ruegeria sp.]